MSTLHTAAPRPRTTRPTTASRALKLVGPVSSRARKAPFVVVVLVLLGIGLVGLILMSTVLQTQSFEAAKLDARVEALTTQQQDLTRQVERLQSPSNLAQRALAIGMVPNTNPVFLRLSDGEVVGKPKPAVARSNVKGVTQ